jgi:hypothetical protein
VQGAVPYYGFVYLLEKLGFTQVVIESLLFYILFLGSGLSMYYFYLKLQGAESTSVGAFSAASVYMMNTYTLVFIWNYFSALAYVYAFLPLVLGVYLHKLDEDKTSFANAFLVSFIWTVTSSAAFGNPTFALYGWIALLFLTLTYQIRAAKVRTVVSSSFFMFKVGLAWLLLNAFWIVPVMFTDIQSEITRATLPVAARSPLSSLMAQNSVSLLDALRLTGFFLLNVRIDGEAIYPWAFTLNLPFLVAISILYPILFSIGVLAFGRTRSAWYAAIILLVGIATCTGQYSSIGQVLMTLLLTAVLTPLFFVTFPRFGMFLAMAVSLGVGLFQDAVWKRAKLVRRVLPVVMILLLLPILNFPFFDGSIMRSDGDILPSQRVEIPGYYLQMSKWLSSHSHEGFLLSLPMSNDGYYWLKWKEGYYGNNPDPWVLDRSVLWANDGGNITSLLLSNLKVGVFPDFAQILSAINVRYVVVHYDTNWRMVAITNSMVPSSPQLLNQLIYSDPNLRVAATFGNITLLENELWKPDSIRLFTSILPEVAVNETPAHVADMPGWNTLHPGVLYSYFANNLTPVVATNGPINETVISFRRAADCPYASHHVFGNFVSVVNSTLLYVRTGSASLVIKDIVGDSVSGAWWDSGCMGVGTEPVSFPIVIPPNERAIISIPGIIGHIVVTVIKPAFADFQDSSGHSLAGPKTGLLAIVSGNATILSYHIVSPVEFQARILSTSAFQLALLQTYSADWVLSSNAALPWVSQYTNEGPYLNIWTVPTVGDHHLTIRYMGQDLLYLGTTITLIVLIIALASILIEIKRVRMQSLFCVRRCTTKS